jgi:hypothetical protein
MKRKSLISKWNQNKKTSSVFENQLCNYLNATRGLHIKPKNANVEAKDSSANDCNINQL